MFARRTVLAALALALALPASAPARQSAQPKAPTGLKAFMLSYDEPTSRVFSRTPSFGWKPLKRSTSYEFELATASSFRENSIVWSTTGLKVPDVSIPLALPWITGKPYSLFARVRARTQVGITPWSDSFGFSVRWAQIPTPLPAPNGLLRWTPVDGASAYEVWELVSNTLNPTETFTKTHYVATNVTDMRDWFTFHQSVNWVGVARWRIRAIRTTYGTAQNSLPTTSYGPWSPVYTTNATTPTTTPLTTVDSVSDVVGTASSPATHALMPGLSWDGTTSGAGIPFELYRVYIFSDEDCTQPVYTGSMVGSPAWVPRLTGGLKLPGAMADVTAARSKILEDGDQAKGYDALNGEVTTNEKPASGSTSPGSDLWDREWPSGVYYWTVVPVTWGVNLFNNTFEYHEVELPQDACAAGRVGTFGRTSQPISTESTKAYVIGLSSAGGMKSMSAVGSPRVYGSAMVTWTPVLAADQFEIQWSQTRYPFEAAGNAVSPATSAVLSLAPGAWYYRVRGIDLQMPAGAQSMAWSTVRKLVITKPVFRLSR